MEISLCMGYLFYFVKFVILSNKCQFLLKGTPTWNLWLMKQHLQTREWMKPTLELALFTQDRLLNVIKERTPGVVEDRHVSLQSRRSSSLKHFSAGDQSQIIHPKQETSPNHPHETNSALCCCYYTPPHTGDASRFSVLVKTPLTHYTFISKTLTRLRSIPQVSIMFRSQERGQCWMNVS